ncbi:MAG: sigma-70 family RNA polymerase sigma factor [Calditrichaeota bacterium]|nr:sigma-70 family RNA polymerase sigma factor [Calditrichota bacterium]MCB9366303.1 sigma-70 family RNA polymerase sigma factor [Calditrichota bacterium]
MQSTDERDDSQLVRAAQEGRDDAFNILVLRHRKSVYHTVLGMVGDRDDAEDLTQDAFVKAYESLGSFRAGSSFYTWLYRIAVNLSLNRLRTRKVRSFFRLDNEDIVLPSADSTDLPVEQAELMQKARAAILKLPDKQRAVFILRYFRELPHAEIAAIMDRDIGTIKANYHQAIRKLRDQLGSYVRGDDE